MRRGRCVCGQIRRHCGDSRNNWARSHNDVTGSFSFLEFFAGGGMARVGLGPAWQFRFANDIDAQKCSAYRANFGGEELIEADITALVARHG